MSAPSAGAGGATGAAANGTGETGADMTRSGATAAGAPAATKADERRRWPVWVLAGGALAAVAGVFLSLYAAHPIRVPVGYDTPKYVWRARLVAAHGMAALDGVPSGVAVSADRPGYPVLISLWSATLGASPLRLAMVFPAATAVMIACGGAAFARTCLLRPALQAPLFALAVGASPLVAAMAGGHADSLLLSIVALGAAVAVLAAAAAERTIVAGALLVGSGADIHWNFAAVVVALLGAVALALVPESLRARREGTRWTRTPSARIAGAVAGGAAVGAAALLLAPGAPAVPGLSRHGFLVKLRQVLPYTWWPMTATAAAVGATAVAADGRRDRRPFRALVLLLVWALTAVVAVVALEAGAAAPAHRVLEFALAIPILAAAGVLAAAIGLARFGRTHASAVARLAASAIVAAAAVGTVAAATHTWHAIGPSIGDAELREIRTAAAYVDAQPPAKSVIFLLDTGSTRQDVDAVLADHWIRLSVDPDHIASTTMYLGDLDRLRAGEKTVRGEERFDRASSRFWSGTRRVLDRDPAIVVLSTLDRSYPAGGAEIAPGVAVVEGAATPVAEADLPRRPGLPLLLLITMGVVGLTAGVGSGWARALLPAGHRGWLSPAMGLAMLVLGGTLVDRLGLRLHGAAAIGVVALLAGAGWLTAVASDRHAPARAGHAG